MKFARIQNGVIEEVGNFASIAGRFHPSLVWVECPEEFDVGDLYNGATFSQSPAPPSPTIGELVGARLLSINAACESAIATIRATYPDSEVLSWPKQEFEARAFVADPLAPTPLLDALAVARGIGKADLAGRVIAKADAFAAISGALIGKRQAFEDALVLATTAEAVAAVVWS